MTGECALQPRLGVVLSTPEHSLLSLPCYSGVLQGEPRTRSLPPCLEPSGPGLTAVIYWSSCGLSFRAQGLPTRLGAASQPWPWSCPVPMSLVYSVVATSRRPGWPPPASSPLNAHFILFYFYLKVGFRLHRTVREGICSGLFGWRNGSRFRFPGPCGGPFLRAPVVLAPLDVWMPGPGQGSGGLGPASAAGHVAASCPSWPRGALALSGPQSPAAVRCPGLCLQAPPPRPQPTLRGSHPGLNSLWTLKLTGPSHSRLITRRQLGGWTSRRCPLSLPVSPRGAIC